MQNQQTSRVLLWDELKLHIAPAEVDSYARKIGIALISRNEDSFQELNSLQAIHNNVQFEISEEIQKKNPSFLDNTRRTMAIEKACKFLDNLRAQGHFVDSTDNRDDSEIIKYLKYSRSVRPNSTTNINQTDLPKRAIQSPRSARRVTNIDESISDVRELLEEEYQEIQVEIANLRCALFAGAEQLEEVKAIKPPPTDSIEAFNKRLQQKDFVIKSINKAKVGSSSVSRLRNSITLNRMWE